jgi:hypothetical protein
VSKYLVRRRKPPSQTWRTFLQNHLQDLVSVDFFTVPTIHFQVLYVFLVLAHERRRIVHFAVTAHPTAEWTAHQLREAFPWETAPRYLLRDRDRIFGHDFANQVKAMGIQQVLSSPRSSWQRAYIERLIGSIRRECLDHFIVFNERTLKRHLSAYAAYYHATRTHLALQKDCPDTGPVQRIELVRLFRYRKLVACTFATSAGPPENLKRPFQRTAYFSDFLLSIYCRRVRPGTVNSGSAHPQTRIAGKLHSGWLGWEKPPLRRRGPSLPHMIFREPQ